MAYTSSRPLRVSLLAAGLLLAVHAHAQDGGPTPKDDVTELDRVVVTANQLGTVTEGSGTYTPGTIATATRLVLTPRETPQSISVVTRQEIEDFNLNSIDSVMAHVPGLSIVTYDSERTEYYARGFPINNFQYDGIPMKRDSSYSSGNTLADMAIYDRVEVLKGAAGLLAGSGDPGAVINLVRKKPTRQFQGHATLGAGSWQERRAEFDVGGPLNADGSVRARAVAAWDDRESSLDRWKRRSTVFYGILEADLPDGTLLTVGADAQDNDPRNSTWGGIPLFNADGGFNAMPRSFNNGATWSRWEQYTRTAFATLEHGFDNEWVAKLQLNHQINGYDALLGASASGFPDPADGEGVALWIGQYVGKTTTDALDLYASGPFQLGGRRHELVVGGSLSRRRWVGNDWWDAPGYDLAVHDYYHWRGDIPLPAWNATPDWHSDETTRENGLYAAVRWNPADTLKFITGARLARYRHPVVSESGIVLPYVGVVWDVAATQSLYASYTSIYSPQLWAQDAQGKPLEPLDGMNYELGWKGAFADGRLNASAAYFQLDQDNYPVPTGELTPSGSDAYRGEQGYRTRGWELEASGQITPRWNVHAGYVHKTTRQQGSKVQTESPENQLTLYTSYRLGDFTFGGGARWQDKTWGDAYHPSGEYVTHTIGSYWLLDASASWRFSDHLSAALSVNNLLDEKYYTVFSWYSTYTWGEPRRVSASVTYRF